MYSCETVAVFPLLQSGVKSGTGRWHLRHTLQQPKSMFDLNSPAQTNDETIQIDRYNVMGSFTVPFNWCVTIKSSCLTSNPTKTRSLKGYAASKTLPGFTESFRSGLAKGLKSRSQAQQPCTCSSELTGWRQSDGTNSKTLFYPLKAMALVMMVMALLVMVIVMLMGFHTMPLRLYVCIN